MWTAESEGEKTPVSNARDREICSGVKPVQLVTRAQLCDAIDGLAPKNRGNQFHGTGATCANDR